MGVKLPSVCGYAPPEDETLVCDRRHDPGVGNHLDSLRGLWFNRTRDGELETSPLGVDLSRIGRGNTWVGRQTG